MDLTFDRMFNPARYGPLMEELLSENRIAPLGPGTPNSPMKPKLEALRVEGLFPFQTWDLDMARACIAGLWFYHDFLDESHTISQEIATPTGSYWHGILHRREPDALNAKYWFRRVGEHPVFTELAEEATEAGYLRTGMPGIRSPSWIPARNTGVPEVRQNGYASGCNSPSGSCSSTIATGRRSVGEVTVQVR